MLETMSGNNKILIIVPAFNESETIVRLITALKMAEPEWEILVVNDGSTDFTGSLSESTRLAHVVNLPYNLGIGASVQTGFKYAYYDKSR